jgi:polysaccharide pyruvyl transferase WcaK-like protein
MSDISFPADHPPIRIGLFGMYASANLGDTAIQSVVISALRRRRPHIDFVGVSHDASDVAVTHGIAAFPASGEGHLVVAGRPDSTPAGPAVASGAAHGGRLRMLLALRNIERQVRGLDMLLVSGGGQIEDFWGGPWRQPFRLLSWCFFAWLHRKPIAVFSVGVDVIRSRLSAWFFSGAFRLADHRTVRDVGSLAELRKWRIRATASVCPDPAFGTVFDVSEVDAVASRAQPDFVVVSPISDRAYPASADSYDGYLTALAAAADWFRAQGVVVKFVCSQTRMDPPIVERVVQRMATDKGIIVDPARTVDEFLRAVGNARLVVASRLHAVILSLVTATPVVAISPARKVTQQMADCGLEDYCRDLHSLDAAALIECSARAMARRDELRSHIQARLKEMRRILERTFDDLAAVVPPQR